MVFSGAYRSSCIGSASRGWGMWETLISVEGDLLKNGLNETAPAGVFGVFNGDGKES